MEVKNISSNENKTNKRNHPLLPQSLKRLDCWKVRLWKKQHFCWTFCFNPTG